MGQTHSEFRLSGVTWGVRASHARTSLVLHWQSTQRVCMYARNKVPQRTPPLSDTPRWPCRPPHTRVGLTLRCLKQWFLHGVWVLLATTAVLAPSPQGAVPCTQWARIEQTACTPSRVPHVHRQGLARPTTRRQRVQPQRLVSSSHNGVTCGGRQVCGVGLQGTPHPVEHQTKWVACTRIHREDPGRTFFQIGFLWRHVAHAASCFADGAGVGRALSATTIRRWNDLAGKRIDSLCACVCMCVRMCYTSGCCESCNVEHKLHACMHMQNFPHPPRPAWSSHSARQSICD
jgi:hypothetical protein